MWFVYLWMVVGVFSTLVHIYSTKNVDFMTFTDFTLWVLIGSLLGFIYTASLLLYVGVRKLQRLGRGW